MNRTDLKATSLEDKRFRGDLLVSAPFLSAVALLVINDWILKPVYGNALTGKLSDVAGLFALGVWICAVFPRWRRIGLLLTGACFAVWKSDMSQPFIEVWNSLGVFRIQRVVDLTDLAALVLLPVAALYSARAPKSAGKGKWGIAVAAISLVCFTATTAERGERFEYHDAVYRFAVSRAALTSQLDSLKFQGAWLTRDPDQYTQPHLGLSVPWDRCIENALAVVRVWGDTARSAVAVEEIIHWCDRERGDEQLLLRLFEDSVISSMPAPRSSAGVY